MKRSTSILILLTAMGFALSSVACAHPRVQPILAAKGDAAKGDALYQTNCVECHGADLKGTELGVNILERLSKRDDAYLANRLMKGLVSMPDFEGILSDDDARDLIAFINTYRSGSAQ